jgi:hypothetical protein
VTLSAFLSFVSVLTLAASAKDVPPVESLLPNTTKGFISIPNLDAFRAKCEQMQLGLLAKDPAVKPFAEDLRRQLESKLDQGGVRLQIKFDDLKAVGHGEFCLASIMPANDPKQHASALILDVTGHLEEAQQLLAKIEQELIRQGSKKTITPVGGVTVTSYLLPKQKGDTEVRRVLYFLRDNRLVASTHEGVVKFVLSRFNTAGDDTLAKLPAFQEIMKGAKAPGATAAQAEVRWYIEPVGLAEVLRAASGGRKKRGTDMLKVLVNQGFGAIQGIGGYVFLMDADKELTHRTLIYAPPVTKTPEKYKLAARMLSFPNAPQLAPQDWVPRDVSTHATFCWRMKEAFEFSKTLIDEAAGAPVFDDVIDSLRDEPNGPRIDIRKDLVAHLGQRAVFFTDYREPITTTCERWFAAVEVTNPEVVARTLDKAMRVDEAKKRLLGKHVIWEIVEEAQGAKVEKVKVAAPGFGRTEEEEENQVNPLLKHAALSVPQGYGYLMVASHVDFMEQVLTQADAGGGLAKAKDYAAVEEALAKLGAGPSNLRFFLRSDKAHHATYELIRQGKMPESETLFGSLLNRLLGPDEAGVLRKQQIQGDRMPPYDKVRGYLGPGGLFITSEDNGWKVVGCLLKKSTAAASAPAPAAGPAAAPVDKPAAKPVDKPEAKPATSPTAKPVPKPVDKPEAKPTASPTAKPAAKKRRVVKDE